MPAAREIAPRNEVGLGARPGVAAGGIGREAGFGQRSIGANVDAGRSGNININRGNTLNAVNVNRTVNGSGIGWHNPYMGYHQGWVHGYWNGNHAGGWAGRGGNGYPGNGYWGRYGGYGMGYGGYGLGYGGFGWGLGSGLGMGLGMGMGYGLSSWLYGPMLYNSGYSNYSNPYYGGGYGGATQVAGQPVVYDYSQPINSTAPTPDETVTNQAMTIFDQARDAFKQEDYKTALDLDDQALRQLPNDPTLHEFRALSFFALGRYDEAAASLYAVLSVGPGWDWTTLINLYSNPETYTQQVRALESSCAQNSRSAAARFVLAYQYMTQGHTDAALAQFKAVVALQPNDKLSAQLVQQLEAAQQPPSEGQTAQGPNPSTPPSPDNVASANPSPSAKEGKLEGTWTAQPAPDTTISLTFQDQGHFTWKVSHQGQDRQFNGNSSYVNGILTLAQDQNNAMVGSINWQDENHFQFKVLGGGPSDPGLSFTKSS
jgi:tetratricopeptide (TPR) repeat protein